MANLNPVASGNKTVSGLVGMVLVYVVSMLLKKYNIVDADGAITTEIVGYIMMGGLTVIGAIHKWIKSRKKK
jgi:hypothetical protein